MNNEIIVTNGAEITFGDDLAEEALIAIEEQWRKVPDCNTKKGYELARVGRGNVRGLRVKADTARKDIKRKYVKLIDGRGKEIVDRLQVVESKLGMALAVIDDEKARVKAEKERVERERVETIRTKLGVIKNFGVLEYGAKLEDIKADLAAAKKSEVTREEYQELYADAKASLEHSLSVLSAAVEAETKREEESRMAAAEQARIDEAQRVEREKLKSERAEQARIKAEQDAGLAKERAKIDAERKEQESAALAQRREAEAKARAMRDAEQAELDKQRAEVEAAQLEIQKEKEAREAGAAERARIANEEEEARLDLEAHAKKYDTALSVLQDMDTDNELIPVSILDAILSGRIPGVRGWK